MRGEQLPRGRALGKRELQKLFVACAKDETAAGRRDAALIAVLYGGGLRRSEVVALDLGDYRPETAELRIRHGKGQKGRVCYATNGAKLALDAWLTARGSDPGPLFWPADGRGRPLVNRRMTDQAVLMLLRRRAAQARVPAFTPHDLRRTFVGDLLEAGCRHGHRPEAGRPLEHADDRAVRPARRGDQAARGGTPARAVRRVVGS